jgi:hypothetical protein
MGLLDFLKNEDNVAELKVFLAALQGVSQSAQQAGQNSNQSIDDLLQNLAQNVGSANVESNVSDISGDENLEADLINQGRITNANVKRTYDTYQNADLESIGRNREHFDRMMAAAQSHTERLYGIAEQNLGNISVNNHAMTQQTIDHRDTSYDRIVNVDEQGYQATEILNNTAFKDGIKVLLVEAVKEAVNEIVSAGQSEDK